MVSSRSLGACLAVGFTLAACNASPQCAGITGPPIVVTVVDGTTGAEICDASVSATQGSVVYNAAEFPPDASTGGSCSYVIYAHVSGIYTVTGSAPGYQSAEGPLVTLQFDSCGYEGDPNNVTIKLARNP